ncbi:NADH-quinone oxidoreductase subunit NuoG [soil metagenome]
MTSPAPNSVEVEIDGKKVEVPQGVMIMDAAAKADVYVPHFCYHKKLSIAANCRMCLVDVEKAPKAVPACATPVTPGMIVRTRSEKAISAQKSVMEFLLINHPLDCPICDQGGECQLQDLAVGYGASSSRYTEEKRVVFHKNIGPLISAEEMTRCIHCTRCVRFGQEVAGIMELGMAGRGEHSEILTFVGRSVDSEISGNMIDLCPVGALTSKPFRYSARSWELARRKSVSPHDSLGSNLIVQVKQDVVMRVLPLENEAINECWLSDRDRFSYEALDAPDRITAPMFATRNADGTRSWRQVEWKDALEVVAEKLREHCAANVGALAWAGSTVEELHLLARLTKGLGVKAFDTRLRAADPELESARRGAAWLGMPITAVDNLSRALIIGSYLRKDHPLFASRIRQSVKSGLKVSIVHAVDDDLLMPVAGKLICAPSDWHRAVNEIAAAVAASAKIDAPEGLGDIEPGEAAKLIAASMQSGQNKVVWLGNAALYHPQAARIAATAQWIAQATGAVFGVLGDAANGVGAEIVGATAKDGRESASQMLAARKSAYLLFNVEPELDLHHGAAARAAMDAASFVVAITPFAGAAVEYADVLLPITPFTETAGAYVNIEGTVQSFSAVARPFKDARPGWKVIRVLGNLLGLEGFDHETAESVRKEALPADLTRLLDNSLALTPSPAVAGSGLALERIAPVGLYDSDAIVRRAPSLQKTSDAAAPTAIAHSSVIERLGLRVGDRVRVRQGTVAAEMAVGADDRLPKNVVRIATGHAGTAALGPMFGEVTLERI